MTARPDRSAHPRIALALRRAASACLLLLAALTCNNVNVVTPPQAPGKPILLASAAVDDTCVAAVYTGHDSTVCAVRLAWGDGDTTAWLPDSSSDTVIAQHAWCWGAQFEVRTQARNAWGVLSDWSAPCTVAVTGLPPFADSLYGRIFISDQADKIAVSPDGDLCYVATCFPVTDTGTCVEVVRLSDMTVIDTVAVPGYVDAIGSSADGEYVYVSWFAMIGYGSGVEKIRVSDFANVARRQFDHPVEDIAVTPDGEQVWLVHGATDQVEVLAASDLRAIDTIAVMSSPTAVLFDSAGTNAYVGYDNAAELTIIDVAAKRVVGSVPLESDCVLDMQNLRANDHLYAVVEGDTCNYQSIDLARQEVDFSLYCDEPIFEQLAVAPAGDWLYLASEDEAYLAVARPNDDRIRACVSVVDSVEGALSAFDVAAQPDGRVVVLDEMGTLRLYGPSRGVGEARIPKAVRNRRVE
jgi:DNA-binding beta-propeller fold protein YncE